MSKLKEWLDSRSIENMMERGVSYFNRHAVSIMVILSATVALAVDIWGETSTAPVFLGIMILFSIRGLMWEEAYWQQAVDLQAQLKPKK
jgi:hypothetical protein